MTFMADGKAACVRDCLARPPPPRGIAPCSTPTAVMGGKFPCGGRCFGFRMWFKRWSSGAPDLHHPEVALLVSEVEEVEIEALAPDPKAGCPVTPMGGVIELHHGPRDPAVRGQALRLPNGRPTSSPAPSAGHAG